MQQPTILIADDHDIVRVGIRMILKKDFPQAKFTEAADGNEVINLVRQQPFDLIITDIHMPDTDSMSMISQILAEKPGTRILIMSMYPENIFAVRYMKAGCYGYVHKGLSYTTLAKAVRTVLTDNKKFMSDFMVDKLSQELLSGKSISNPFEDLSNREMEVVIQLAKGYSIAEIADMLKVHPSTVTSHKARSFEKLQINNIIALKDLVDTYKII